MKSSYIVMIISLALFSGTAFSQVARDNSGRPCYDVNIQIDPRNQSRVQQDCDRNYSRTMQAGKNNEAITEQRGRINDNSVRQYGYEAAPRRR